MRPRRTRRRGKETSHSKEGSTIDTPRIKAVVFDLDDTLYLERSYAASGFAAVAESLTGSLGDPEAVATELVALFDTPHRPRVFNELFNRRSVPADEEQIKKLVTVYRRHIPTISLCEDADRALDRLRVRFKLGVITDGPMITQSLKLKALKLTGRLDKTVITSELGPAFSKPHPKAFEWMARALDATHAQCAYVADNVAKDFLAPNQLGWRSILIVRPGAIYPESHAPEGGRPDHTIESLDDLDPLLDGSCP